MTPSSLAPVGGQAAPSGPGAWQDGATLALGPAADGGATGVLGRLEALVGRAEAFAAPAQDAARFGPSGAGDPLAQSLREIERVYDAAFWKQLCIALPQQAKGSLDTLLRQG